MKNIRLNLQNVASVAPGLWTIGSLFEQEDFQYITEQILKAPNNCYTASPASDLRHEMTWITDGILEEVHETFQRLNDHVSNLIHKKVRFNQVRIWKDAPGYRIPFHEDDRVAVGHIQIYINGSQKDAGTTWYTTAGKTTLPFVPNTGYLTECSYMYPHGMLVPVANENRYSLYATFQKNH